MYDFIKLKNKHISQQFNEELENTFSQLMQMGGLVEEQLSESVKALNKKNIKLAKKVIENDKKINMMEIRIHDDCILVISKRQPTASDLRLIIAIFKTIFEIERIGDVARKISYLTLLKLPDEYKDILNLIEELIKAAHIKFHETLDAFVRMDLEEATRLYLKNKHITELAQLTYKKLLKLMHENEAEIENAIEVQNIVHSIEKIDARCQNICELIVYVVKGENIKYQGKKVFFAIAQDDE